MQNSGIEWTNHTTNPWWGCNKISPECSRCYAANISGAYGGPKWGASTDRKLRVGPALAELARHAKLGARLGVPQRVFVASMADIFEARADLEAPRHEFLTRAQEIPGAEQWLRLLLLTKRPEVMADYADRHGWPGWWWAGTTAGHERSVERLSTLARVPARVRFVSAEPLLTPVDLDDHLPTLGWVIVGGESGPGARPMHPDWVRRLRDASTGAGVPFFFKQWGEWSPEPGDGLRVHTFPDQVRVYWHGKKGAGKTLDGQTWLQVPTL